MLKDLYKHEGIIQFLTLKISSVLWHSFSNSFRFKLSAKYVRIDHNQPLEKDNDTSDIF